jgi:hypothetical protein
LAGSFRSAFKLLAFGSAAGLFLGIPTSQVLASHRIFGNPRRPAGKNLTSTPEFLADWCMLACLAPGISYLTAKGLLKTLARIGSNKPAILQARVLELSAQGILGRRMALELNINRRTVARILAGPEARSIVLEAWERAKNLVCKGRSTSLLPHRTWTAYLCLPAFGKCPLENQDFRACPAQSPSNHTGPVPAYRMESDGT